MSGGLPNESREAAPAVDAAQLELTSLLELEARACEEVANGAGHEDVAGLREGEDSRRRMDGDPADLVALELDLTGVDAGAGGQTKR